MKLLRAKSFGGYRIYYNIIYIDELMEHMYRIGFPLYIKALPRVGPTFLLHHCLCVHNLPVAALYSLQTELPFCSSSRWCIIVYIVDIIIICIFGNCI
jgi:hypothetical protein